jgi:hypothetical protein
MYHERENKFVLVDLCEGTTGCWRGKEILRMKNIEKMDLYMNAI